MTVGVFQKAQAMNVFPHSQASNASLAKEIKVFHNTKYKKDIIDVHNKQIKEIHDPIFQDDDEISSPLHSPSRDLENPFDKAKHLNQSINKPMLKQKSIPVTLNGLGAHIHKVGTMGSLQGDKNLDDILKYKSETGSVPFRRELISEDPSPVSIFSRFDKNDSFGRHSNHELPELKGKRNPY